MLMVKEMSYGDSHHFLLLLFQCLLWLQMQLLPPFRHLQSPIIVKSLMNMSKWLAQKPMLASQQTIKTLQMLSIISLTCCLELKSLFYPFFIFLEIFLLLYKVMNVANYYYYEFNWSPTQRHALMQAATGRSSATRTNNPKLLVSHRCVHSNACFTNITYPVHLEQAICKGSKNWSHITC